MSNNYAPARLREDLQNEELHALREAGLIRDPEVIDFLEDYRRFYDGEGDHYEEDRKAEVYHNAEEYVDTVRREIGKTLSWAIQHDKRAILDHAIGLVEKESIDAGQLEWVEFVDNLVKPDDRHHMLNLAIIAPPPPIGPTGVGKSLTGYSIIETLQYISDITFASNNETDPFHTNTSWTELVEWLETTDGQKLFFWDEAAQTLMYDDQVSGKELAKLIRLLRKYNCHLILIGHTGMGLPKDPRRMLSFLQKQDQKSAVYGVGLEEAKNGWMEITNELKSIENIPKSTVQYDDINDKGVFEFDAGESTENDDSENSGTTENELGQFAAELYWETDMSYRELEEKFEVPKSTIQRVAKEIEDEYSDE